MRSLGERIVLYILNRIVYRVGEMDKPEVPFLCHGQNHFAKLLWKDGHAVGFYSVKPKGFCLVKLSLVAVIFGFKPYWSYLIGEVSWRVGTGQYP